MRKHVIGLVVAAALAAPAHPQPTAQVEHGIGYLNGGVGATEQRQMQAQRANYNLLLTFAARTSGAYLANVQVDISDSAGNPVLSHADSGPMLFVQLPPGTYRIRAAAADRSFTRTVRLGSTGRRELVLHWAGDAEDDPTVLE